MHINVLSELCPVNDPWKPSAHSNIDSYDKNLIKIFAIDSNFSQGIMLSLPKTTPLS